MLSWPIVLCTIQTVVDSRHCLKWLAMPIKFNKITSSEVSSLPVLLTHSLVKPAAAAAAAAVLPIDWLADEFDCVWINRNRTLASKLKQLNSLTHSRTFSSINPYEGAHFSHSLKNAALGQLIAQPNGMNCLARHNETLQWLYTLLTSQVSSRARNFRYEQASKQSIASIKLFLFRDAAAAAARVR